MRQSALGRAVWRLLRKLTVELPYDPMIVLLGIDPKNTITVTQKDTVSLMLTAALFPTATWWKQPTCPP